MGRPAIDPSERDYWVFTHRELTYRVRAHTLDEARELVVTRRRVPPIEISEEKYDYAQECEPPRTTLAGVWGD